MSVFVALGWSGVLPSWIVTLVVFRDALIVGGAILYQMVIGDLRMRPLMISKANTVAQVALGRGPWRWRDWNWTPGRWLVYSP